MAPEILRRGKRSQQIFVDDDSVKSAMPIAMLDAAIPLPRIPMRWASVVVFIVSVTCFANSYDASFAFDDSEAIIDNKDLNPDASNMSDLFVHDFWGNKLTSNLSHKSYRPLTVLTFRLNYWMAGGLHPMAFHVVNIFLHGVVSSLFLVVFAIFVRDCDDRHSSDEKMPLLCALMFAIHPVHTENVAAIVGRADLLCALCFILTFICYSEALRAGLSNWKKCFFSSLVLFFVVCSLLFKEQGITVLGVCVAYDLLVVNKIHPKMLLSIFKFSKSLLEDDISSRKRKSGQNSMLALRILLIAIFGFVILILRWKIMGSEPPTFHPVDNPQSFINSTLYRIINYNYLYTLNAWLLLNPWWLCFDWSMGCVPLIDSPSDFRLLPVGIFLLIFSWLLISAASQRPSAEQRFLVMSLVLLLLPFLPASNVLFRVGFVIAERNLYLTSAGFVMITSLGISKLCRANKQVCSVFIVFLLITNMIRSIQRSSQWKNEKVLFESGALVCPLNAKIHYNIGKLYADEGKVGLAIAKYQQALRLNPVYDQAMNNLGNLYKDRGNLSEAETLLMRAVEIRPDFSTAWMNLGIVQASLRKYRLAEKSYLTALRHRRKYPDCYYNLGNLYLEEERHEEALSAWQNATFQKPTHLSAWTNMILLLDNQGRLSDLEFVVSIALQHNPNEPSIHFNYASALGKAGRYKESEKHFLAAISSNNKVAMYRSNLGVLYHRWGKLDLAEKEYKAALALEPSNKQTKNNLQLLYQKLSKVSS